MKVRLAQWPAPKNITALSTTRLMGYSQPPYHHNNLGLHVGDQEEAVVKNRHSLIESFHLPGEPQWLQQTHSTDCVLVESESTRQADAAVTRSKKHPLVILTADCLPIVLCSLAGNEIAAIHAGWRGLAQGIIENTLQKMQTDNKKLIAWVGPAICHRCYEVGNEVYEIFVTRYPLSQSCFKAQRDKWRVNLAKIAEIILYSQGIDGVYQSGFCTFEAEDLWYSYRKSTQTGRIGTFIWFNDQL